MDAPSHVIMDREVPGHVTMQRELPVSVASSATAISSTNDAQGDVSEKMAAKWIPTKIGTDGKFFAEATSLQKSGNISRKWVLRFLRDCGDMLKSKETMQLLRAAYDEAGDQPLHQLCMRLQFELMEAKGVERHFGSKTLNPPVLLQTYGDDEIKDELQNFVQLCNDMPGRVRAFGEARHYACAQSLQTSGKLQRGHLLAFLTAMPKELLSEEVVKALKETKLEHRNSACVRFQHEYLEHLGIDSYFGVSQLRHVLERFKGDDEVLRAFKGFQMACVCSIQKANMLDERPVATVTKDPSLRFGVGDCVECKTPDGWEPGHVSQLHYREPGWPANQSAPYQIRLKNQMMIFAPHDSDQCIRKPTT
mmetsp:Transcript_4292/g.7195  ORF Transcript_4292/g.7195 Transcript_4292/m.7195 type:complete len:364 (+) Transcript_4292:43-1134(+)